MRGTRKDWKICTEGPEDYPLHMDNNSNQLHKMIGALNSFSNKLLHQQCKKDHYQRWFIPTTIRLFKTSSFWCIISDHFTWFYCELCIFISSRQCNNTCINSQHETIFNLTWCFTVFTCSDAILIINLDFIYVFVVLLSFHFCTVKVLWASV